MLLSMTPISVVSASYIPYTRYHFRAEVVAGETHGKMTVDDDEVYTSSSRIIYVEVRLSDDLHVISAPWGIDEDKLADVLYRSIEYDSDREELVFTCPRPPIFAAAEGGTLVISDEWFPLARVYGSFGEICLHNRISPRALVGRELPTRINWDVPLMGGKKIC